MKLIYSIVLITCTVSCNINKDRNFIKAKYLIDSVNTPFKRAIIKFENSGQFSFEWEMHHTAGKTSGNFYLRNDTIIINSRVPELSYLVKTNPINLNDSVSLQANQIDQKALYMANKNEICYLTNAKALINSDTIIFIENDNIPLSSRYKFYKK